MDSIPIIFENNDFLVLNKPSGIVVHPYDFSTEETIVDFLHEKIPESFTIENSVTLQDSRTINLGGIVHKLDRNTSGVLVVAKNKETFTELQSQFRNHTISKKYIALVEGNIKEETLVIDSPLGRNKKDYKQVANPINPRGELREALTHLHVLQRNEQTTFVELIPKTGRTHQLRAHMNSIGHPIVGDTAYGAKKIPSDRIILHAESLSFVLGGKEYTFTAERPEGF